MINKEKITLDWIKNVSLTNKNADKILVEKVIRALLLLEGLAANKIAFIFKGGTALMLHLGSTKRLSIDIDIVLKNTPKEFETILDKISKEQGFIRKEEQKRQVNTTINKRHFKFFYIPLHKTKKEEEYILLDILQEDVNYQSMVQLSIESQFIPAKDNPVLVNVPSMEDLLGDKLTAFAPETTGIPYYKNEDSMSMEIIKQLYDIGNLFDRVTDINIIKSTFKNFAHAELLYRNNDKSKYTVTDVLDDIFNTSLCIVSRGTDGIGNFKELLLGIQRVKGFIFSESYHLEKAIIHASKAAYIATLIKYDAFEIQKYSNPQELKDWMIFNPQYNQFNKLKKSSPEAFFYWHKISTLYDNTTNL